MTDTRNAEGAASSKPTIVGLSGNWTTPSRTRTVVQAVLDEASRRELAQTALYDLSNAGPALGTTMERSKADETLEALMRRVESADAVVVGSSVYKGAYTGLFKHFFDLFDPEALRRKPVILTATGGSPAHASIIDYHLRPLFLFFDAAVASRGLYALPQDFEQPDRLTTSFAKRVEACVDELALLLDRIPTSTHRS